MGSNGSPQTTSKRFGAQSMIAPLRRVLVHIPGGEYTRQNWLAWGYSGEPNLEVARREHEAFIQILRDAGVEIDLLEEHGGLGTTATYDPVLITDEGAVMLRSGREERRAEVMPMARKLLQLEIPIIGWIRDEGCIEGGDTLWLDQETLLVGRSYRSNDEGYRQLRHTLDGIVREYYQFELPHWHGPQYVLHLMSVVSLVSEDLALVYPRAVPIRLWQLLQERAYRLIEVADDEFERQGCNVLALAPNRVVMCAGNPVTSARLRDLGVEVIEYDGNEISVRWTSGPTCNTRPLLRA